jgi:hypothetical protein
LTAIQPEVNFTNIFERNCAIFFAPIKSLTFTSSTIKLFAKLLFKKYARKMLVKLTHGRKMFLVKDSEAKKGKIKANEYRGRISQK